MESALKPVTRLCAAALSVALAAVVPPPAYAESIASKVDQLGQLSNVSITSLRTTNRAGLLFLEATFSNASIYDDSFEYRIKWIDRDGFPAGTDEAWKPVLIHGLQRLSIQSIAPSPDAADFRIELHSPNNVAPANTTNTANTPGH
ncbi:YcfL family protein [Paraburkholderia sp. J63]|uniref:YcfL family protein n=1 Tax=Paraburkholderia sp. J63 TaxID=2805434 RepID=UPI002ABD91E1|nr:YcfL family protein [Paraburkholderia sp. J63]